MILISTYHEFEREEFKLEVVSEDDLFYYVRLLPEYQDSFREKDSITPLSKCLVGEDNLYKVYTSSIHVQLTLFDI